MRTTFYCDRICSRFPYRNERQTHVLWATEMYVEIKDVFSVLVDRDRGANSREAASMDRQVNRAAKSMVFTYLLDASVSLLGPLMIGCM